MRKIVKAADVALLFGKSTRQSSRLLCAVKVSLGKQRHQHVTVQEFAHYYGIPEKEVEHTIEYNDN